MSESLDSLNPAASLDSGELVINTTPPTQESTGEFNAPETAVVDEDHVSDEENADDPSTSDKTTTGDQLEMKKINDKLDFLIKHVVGDSKRVCFKCKLIRN